MQVYVINLERNPERLEFIAQRLESLKIDFVRVDAVDGYALDKEYVKEFREQSKRPTGWKEGQIGCFLSHRKVWELISAGDEDCGIVFEDDLHIADSIKKVISDLGWMPGDADVVRLENTTNWVKITNVGKVQQRDICLLGSDSWCTGAYVITKQAANYLINQDRSLWLPSDTYMFSKSLSQVARQLNIYQFNPSLVCQDKFSESVDGESQRKNFGSEIEGNSADTHLKVTFKQQIKNFVAPFLGYKRIRFED